MFTFSIRDWVARQGLVSNDKDNPLEIKLVKTLLLATMDYPGGFIANYSLQRWASTSRRSSDRKASLNAGPETGVVYDRVADVIYGITFETGSIRYKKPRLEQDFDADRGPHC